MKTSNTFKQNWKINHILVIGLMMTAISGFSQTWAGKLNTTDKYLYPGNDLFISKDVNGNAVQVEYVLNFNRDGNLYIKKGSSYGQIIWSSNTKSKNPIKLKVQDNGDMVLYNSNEEKVETSVWSTGTVGRGGSGTFLKM